MECQSEEEAREAIAAGAHIVMLDNFSPEGAKEVALKLKKSHPHVIMEVSFTFSFFFFIYPYPFILLSLGFGWDHN